MKMKMEYAGHILDGFGIFGPCRIQYLRFKTQILLIHDFEFRFAQTISTSEHCTTESGDIYSQFADNLEIFPYIDSGLEFGLIWGLPPPVRFGKASSQQGVTQDTHPLYR